MPPLFVAFTACPSYRPSANGAAQPDRGNGTNHNARLKQAVDAVVASAGITPAYGSKILVKPNLLRADGLTCTNPLVMRALCEWLLDHGACLTVADSPGFGTAAGVAHSIGLTEALQGLPVQRAPGTGSLLSGIGIDCSCTPPNTNSIPFQCAQLTPQGMGQALRQEIPGLGALMVSRMALESDAIFSVPRLKAHTQMRITCAVKNLFGCITGVHKAFLHARHGDQGKNGNDLPRLIASLTNILPVQYALVDGITVMHRTGPSFGDELDLGFLAASSSCVAMDTAVYSLLGLEPHAVPLWSAAQELELPGARRDDIVLCGHDASAFPWESFTIPKRLSPHSFNPLRLLVSMVKRLYAASKGA